MDILALTFPSKDWLRKGALFLYGLGAVSTIGTFLSGRQAADSVEVPLAAQSALAEHENLALYTLWFFGVFVVLRFALYRMIPVRRWLHALFIVVSAGGQVLLFETADHGGALVYRHGIAVRRPVNPPEQTQKPEAVASGPIMDQKGIAWSFGPGSEKRLLEFLETPGSTLKPVDVKMETVDGKSVLTIKRETKEPLMLVFKSTYNDVQVEAELDSTSFDGKVALVHHVHANGYDYFMLVGQKASLGRDTNNKQKIFAEGDLNPDSRLIQIKAVSVDGHFRGYLGNKLVIHGHGPNGSPGKAGILIEGTGTVRLGRLAVSSLVEHQM